MLLCSAFTGAQAGTLDNSLNAGSYTVNYDDTTAGFGGIASWSSYSGGASFEFNVQPSVSVAAAGGGAVATFALPDFTLVPNAGNALSDPTAFLGNLVFNSVGTVTSATVTGNVSVNGGTPVGFSETLGASGVSVFGPITTGVYSGTQGLLTGSFDSLSLTGGVLTLSVGAGYFGSIVGQSQNQLNVAFNVSSVPEPQTYALMLAGLGMCAFMMRRRREV